MAFVQSGVSLKDAVETLKEMALNEDLYLSTYERACMLFASNTIETLCKKQKKFYHQTVIVTLKI